MRFAKKMMLVPYSENQEENRELNEILNSKKLKPEKKLMEYNKKIKIRRNKLTKNISITKPVNAATQTDNSTFITTSPSRFNNSDFTSQTETPLYSSIIPEPPKKRKLANSNVTQISFQQPIVESESTNNITNISANNNANIRKQTRKKINKLEITPQLRSKIDIESDKLNSEKSQRINKLFANIPEYTKTLGVTRYSEKLPDRLTRAGLANWEKFNNID